MFKKAEKKKIKLRCAIDGPAGSGKTWTALSLGKHLRDKYGYKLAVIDSERGSASKYADFFDFDSLELDDYDPQNYINGINMAEQNGYNVLIIDSLSHAWAGTGGLLDKVDAIAKRSKSGNSFTAWREATPLHNKLVDTMLAFNGHLIVTMRTKTEYIVETVNGKSTPRKVGMAPIQRDGVEYEFDIVGDMDLEHNLVISKTRCHPLADKVFSKPDADFAKYIIDWIGDETITPEDKEQPPEQPPKPEPPKPQSATEQQLNLVRTCLSAKDVPNKLKSSATAFLNDISLQTAENASKLLAKLTTLPELPKDKDAKTALLVDIERYENEYYEAVKHRENGREKYLKGYQETKVHDLSKYDVAVLRDYADKLEQKIDLKSKKLSA